MEQNKEIINIKCEQYRNLLLLEDEMNNLKEIMLKIYKMLPLEERKRRILTKTDYLPGCDIFISKRYFYGPILKATEEEISEHEREYFDILINNKNI